MKRLIRRIAAAVALFALAGCAGSTPPGMFNGLGNDPMAMIAIYRTDGKAVTPEQYRAIQDIALGMNLVLEKQISSSAEAAASGFGAYGAAGAAGGAMEPLFYPGALGGAAAGYTGLVYGFGGLVNGLTTYSYSYVYDVAEMVETAMRDREKYDGATEFQRIHVVAAFVRSRNNIDSPAPGLVPDFHGEPSGSPTR